MIQRSKMPPQDDSVQLVVSNTTPAPQVKVYRGGSSGGGDDMDGRVARLESDVKDIKDTLHRLEPILAGIGVRLTQVVDSAQFATLTERVSHIPSTTKLVVILLTVFCLGMGIPQIPNIISYIRVKHGLP